VCIPPDRMQRAIPAVSLFLTIVILGLFNNSDQKPTESQPDEICIEKPKNKTFKISSNFEVCTAVFVTDYYECGKRVIHCYHIFRK